MRMNACNDCTEGWLLKGTTRVLKVNFWDFKTLPLGNLTISMNISELKNAFTVFTLDIFTMSKKVRKTNVKGETKNTYWA